MKQTMLHFMYKPNKIDIILPCCYFFQLHCWPTNLYPNNSTNGRYRRQ